MPRFGHPVSLWDHFDIAMVRPRADWVPTLDAFDGMFVQLGPGKKNIDSWDNLDYPDWDADKDKLPYQDDSVDGVATYHSMDHFSRPTFVLAEVQRVLKVGGWFVNIVPHYSSELANSCIEHKSRFAVDTWRNIFSERQYDHGPGGWQFRIGFNMLMGLTERNLVLVTQLIKDPENPYRD